MKNINAKLVVYREQAVPSEDMGSTLRRGIQTNPQCLILSTTADHGAKTIGCKEL
jgi:hypothetical protein